MLEGSDRLPDAIEGCGLVLRCWLPSDVDEMGRAVERNLDHLRPWMPWASTEPLERSQRLKLIESWRAGWSEGGDAAFGAFADDGVVGACGLHRRRGPGGLEIGYWVDRDHLRQGVALAIAGMLTTAAFAIPGITFVEIHHDKANLASRGVPRKLGYELIGEAPDQISAPAEVGIDCSWRLESGRWASSSSLPEQQSAPTLVREVVSNPPASTRPSSTT
jgi:RimJ/RimL family protein N-acetyltransferase